MLDSTNVFLFDCDGVLWHGDTAIPGAAATIAHLKALGKKVYFVTNNSTKSRKVYVGKFKRLGIPAEPDEILCSAFAAALVLKDHPCLMSGDTGDGATTAAGHPKRAKKVYVIGEQGIIDELDEIGIESVGGPEHVGKVVDMSAGKEPCVDPDIGAVVVGFDRHLSYFKVQYAFRCIQELGATFIATNTDPCAPLTPGYMWGGAGSMVGAVAACSGVQPTVAGKPSATFLDYIITQGVAKSTSEMCMVGDRLSTDILFGASNGLKTVLTLSGVTSREDLGGDSVPARPDFVAETVSELVASS